MLLGFQMHQMALALHAVVQGVWLVSGLQVVQVYWIFLRCSSFMAAMVLSSRSMNSVTSSRAFFGQLWVHLVHPVHLSESTTM